MLRPPPPLPATTLSPFEYRGNLSRGLQTRNFRGARSGVRIRAESAVWFVCHTPANRSGSSAGERELRYHAHGIGEQFNAFPPGGQLRVLPRDQIVVLGTSAPYETSQVCAKPDSTHLTLCAGTRGLSGTTAASHVSGQLVSGSLSAYHINSLSAWMIDMATKLAQISST